ncbi:hypothetical protein BC829DRAFT_379354 [Chytridium lagenaria]|nr:hypothetical protein BC829DRAFT_379354 [Chytridium lagenaria]
MTDIIVKRLYGLTKLKQQKGTMIPDVILLLEHAPVFTAGRRLRGQTVEEGERLKRLTGADFDEVMRGGQITFHGPGQLVAYPILNLKDRKLGAREYVSMIEKSIIRVCEGYNLNPKTSEHTGVWVNDKKIAAIGVHISRYITLHGLALNCDTDLNWFKHIVPCGIPDKEVTSLTKEIGRRVFVDNAIQSLILSFEQVFKSKLVDIKEADPILDDLIDTTLKAQVKIKDSVKRFFGRVTRRVLKPME